MTREHGTLAASISRLRTRTRDGGTKPLTLAEAARRTGLWGGTPITTGAWSQAERGRIVPQALTLVRMALACDAGPQEIRELFYAAGYDTLFDVLVGIDLDEAPPETAEAGILADTRIPYERRQELLELLHDAVEAEGAGTPLAAEQDQGES